MSPELYARPSRRSSPPSRRTSNARRAVVAQHDPRGRRVARPVVEEGRGMNYVRHSPSSLNLFSSCLSMFVLEKVSAIASRSGSQPSAARPSRRALRTASRI
jgi:hypothetical protein